MVETIKVSLLHASPLALQRCEGRLSRSAGRPLLHAWEIQKFRGAESVASWTRCCPWPNRRVRCHVTRKLWRTLNCFQIFKKNFSLPFPQAKNSPQQAGRASSQRASKTRSLERTGPSCSQPREPIWPGLISSVFWRATVIRAVMASSLRRSKEVTNVAVRTGPSGARNKQGHGSQDIQRGDGVGSHSTR